MSASIDRSQLLHYLDAFLEGQKGRDYGPNGLQVEGRAEISKLVTGVSACRTLFERARDEGADAILVHHGLFWEGTPRTLTGFQHRRVATLIRAGMSLFAYHLPLDRHPDVGNNAVAARAFGLEEIELFGLHEGLALGFRGRFPTPLRPEELVTLCQTVYGQAPLSYLSGPAEIATVGIVSGGAQRDVYQAIDAGLDAFVTGEVSEWVMNVAHEAGIHYLAAGHYATERLGVQALGDHLQRRLGIEVEFIDVPNPV